LLVQGIPAYRLPRELVRDEIALIERLGVSIRTRQRLGRDFTLESLRTQGYEAVFLGVGAPGGRQLGVPGSDAEGVVDAMVFLREHNLRGKGHVGRDVAVIGGGNAAIDAARVAVRLGARSVSVLYRRTRDEMPAYAEEIREAEREGVRIHLLVAPERIVAEHGKVVAVHCSRMTTGGFDSSGRRCTLPCNEPPLVFQADQVIGAIGQTLDLRSLANGCALELDRSGYLRVNTKTGQTSLPWVFAGGDASSGPSSVVRAVKGGERAAVGIDLLLTGSEHAFWRQRRKVDTFFDPDADPVTTPRTAVRTLLIDKRRGSFAEVEQTMNAAEAVREARRCLRCDFREAR